MGEKPIEEPIATKLMREKPDGVAEPPHGQEGGLATPKRPQKIINNGFWLPATLFFFFFCGLLGVVRPPLRPGFFFFLK
jgi:hypothetical protein